MAFRNPVFAGTYLVRTAMQSPNYAAGSAGWSINRDGSAELNNVRIRGATTSQGVSLYYNGTPALGNMIVSIAPVAGTDSFGNAYPQGITTYNGSGVITGTWNLGTLQTIDPVSSGYAKILPSNTVRISPTLSFAGGGGSSSQDARMYVYTDTVDTGQPFEVLSVFGPTSTADPAQSYTAVQLAAGGTVNDGAVGLIGGGDNTHSYAILTWGPRGINGAGKVWAVDPASSPAATETWHTTSLAAGWTQHAGAQCRYRLQPDGFVQMQGFMDFSGTLSSGATITGTALPTAYRPLQTWLGPVCISGNVFGQLQVNPTGTAQIFFSAASLTNPTLVWDPVRFPVI